MWGNLVTETAFVYSFTFGFPTKQSDILMHLTHWQYWFWFWFTYYLVLYYFIFLRLVRYRVLKMSPKLVTSFRSHGKWGDLLVCFIPLSWCTNILSNSNFILRMIEWQSESSLFTLRVRGKQWYWVYKFELKSLIGINTAAINLGNNFWVNKESSNRHHYLGLIQEKHSLAANHMTWNSSGSKQFLNNTETTTNLMRSATPAGQSSQSVNLNLSSSKQLFTSAPNNYYLSMNYAWRNSAITTTPASYSTPTLLNNHNSVGGVSTIQPTITRVNKVSNFTYSPVRLTKTADSTQLEAVYSSGAVFKQKPTTNNFYLVVKQKRYAPTSMASNKYNLNTQRYFTPTQFSAKNKLFLAQHTQHRDEILSLQSNRRLLRTKRVLVLPAHTNITLITNSFDVMHSWYVPGLGVKLDCVPGRSTHHTIHIDHAGFYYGQCAEICGRYHHHMPIRVCALPFEHFLIWWYHYGAPFFLAGNQDRASYIRTASKQINW